ncbi:uncharacterized protein LOC131950267 [Physella acuta]|uniref:uncharacterized protein LOC131950267 n=1 Tax=Physella acuta TaxID=109671 RepID=UPI0027DDB137|nr:uncharacterized protein LOC131950267 [Physella acuta]
MNILKSIISGRNASLCQKDRPKAAPAKISTGSGVSVTDSLPNGRVEMEFMYCIPDLEVFIDKTIKKCLLEYDLDANDTEAVLDDMEKAWPKTPPRNSEKQVLKDCNDNTEKVLLPDKDGADVNSRDILSKGNSEETGFRKNENGGMGNIKESLSADRLSTGMMLKDGSLSNGAVLNNGASETLLKDSAHERRAVLKNGVLVNGAVLKDGGALINGSKSESDRSGSSSPDVDDKSTVRKHAKLKSRLQQRYFEGTQDAEHQTGQRVQQETTSPKPASNMQQQPMSYGPSNLDILASAVNLHTESLRQVEGDSRALQAMQEASRHVYRQVRDDIPRQHDAFRHQTMDIGGRLPHSREIPNMVRRSSASPIPYSYVNTAGRASHSPHSLSASTMAVSSARENSLYEHSIPEQRVLQYSANEHQLLLFRESASRRDAVRNGTSEFHSSYSNATLDSRQHASTASYGQALNSAYQHNLKSQTHSEAHVPPQRHSSRIASIIAEELQKDEDCRHKAVVLKHGPLVERVNPDEIKVVKNSQLKLNDGSQNRNHGSINSYWSPQDSSSNQRYIVDNILHGYPYGHRNPHVLPSHLSDVHTTNSILTSVQNISSTDLRNGIYKTQSDGLDDNQPQDLSIKPKLRAPQSQPHNHQPHNHQPHNHQHTYLTPDSPINDAKMNAYFSSPNSPLNMNNASGHQQNLAQRKSASPTVNSNKGLDYKSPNNGHLRLSGKWERKGQVHTIDSHPALTRESKDLAERRRAEAIKKWSDNRQGEITKKRANYSNVN